MKTSNAIRGVLRYKRQSTKAFTLVELLVVIAVIGILASVLLPTLARAKAIAHSTKCKSNLHQMGLALRMYLDDRGVFPQTHAPGLPNESWSYPSLTAYLGGLPAREEQATALRNWKGTVFDCPADRRKWRGYGGSYGYNANGITGFSVRDHPDRGLGLGGRGSLETLPIHLYWDGPVPESAPLVPSDMMAIADGYVGAGPFLNGQDLPWDAYESQGEFIREGLASVVVPFRDGAKATGRKRHVGKLNVLFCDMHVEGIKVQALFFSKQDENMRRWNIDHEPHRERLRLSLR